MENACGDVKHHNTRSYSQYRTVVLDTKTNMHGWIRAFAIAHMQKIKQFGSLD